MALRTRPNEKYEALLAAAKQARLPFDREAWLNIAFFRGNQYTTWSDDTAGLTAIPRHKNAPNAPRPVANKIMHFVLQEHATVLQSRPTVDVLPTTDNPEDISTANVALAFLTWLAGEQVANFNRVLSLATMWSLAGTESYLKWTWNPRITEGGRGDIRACSPFDVYPDPYADDFANARYVIHSQFMDVEQVYDIYGQEIKAGDTAQADKGKVALLRAMGMAPVLSGAVVNELWMKPCRRYPDGLFVVWAGNTQLVEPGPFPYAHKHLPFTQIGSIILPGTLHRTSAVSFMRDPQMELNKFHQQMIVVRDNYANPKWFLATELELNEDPDDSPNQILRGHSQNGLLKPEIIQPASMAPNDQGAWIAKEMMDVVGIHEVSQGQVPGRVEAAKAIEMLQESDNGRLAELLRSIGAAISEGYWQQLQLVKQFGREEQIIQTYSPEGGAEVHRLKTAKIAPGMRVRVMMGTGLAASRAARTDQIMLLWQNGIIKDADKVAELMDVPVSSFDPDNAYDLRLAENENLTMADGTPITPNSWDNHDIHLRKHNNYRKTHEFALLPDKVKSMFEFHCQTHDKLQIQELGKQLQKQQLTAAVAAGAPFQQAGLQPPNAEGAQPDVSQIQAESPQQQAAFRGQTEFDLLRQGK